MSQDERAGALRREAEAKRARLAQLERMDWPRWLREADGVSREISELLRQAAELERGGAARYSGTEPPCSDEAHASF